MFLKLGEMYEPLASAAFGAVCLVLTTTIALVFLRSFRLSAQKSRPRKNRSPPKPDADAEQLTQMLDDALDENFGPDLDSILDNVPLEADRNGSGAKQIESTTARGEDAIDETLEQALTELDAEEDFLDKCLSETREVPLAKISGRSTRETPARRLKIPAFCAEPPPPALSRDRANALLQLGLELLLLRQHQPALEALAAALRLCPSTDTELRSALLETLRSVYQDCGEQSHFEAEMLVLHG